MTIIAKTTEMAGRFPVIFKGQDFVRNDGKSLLSFSALVQAAIALAFLFSAWPVFAAEQPVGVGGPFEAVEPLKTADPNFKSLFTSWKTLDQLEQGTIAIPSAMPVKGTSLTSKYGVRSDPFQGRAAMHAGVDLAGPLGTPIYATADGIVERSNWVNGYGNLVELSHGRGIQTRYGHLSKSLVTAGQKVKRGDLIALMGSTGRSTGSHLHYEVRVDGRAVNPIPFMQSNEYLAAVQRRAALALGGPGN